MPSTGTRRISPNPIEDASEADERHQQRERHHLGLAG